VGEGDTIRLVVIAIDPVARRMTFSLKQAGPDPWNGVHERYATDTVVSGKVTRIAEFGAFVELEPGLEGLVHISELSPQRVRQVGDVVKVGQDVRVRILEIDAENRRMGLSLKRADAGSAALSGAAAEAPAEKPAPSKSQLKKKKPPLRGGLDF
jgi:small subunit ribosomal protein S1